MNQIVNKTLCYFFITCCVITIIFSVKFIVTSKWSPIDEYAHMDYILKLEEGKLPKLSDPISDELFLHIKNNPDKIVGNKVNTREELGFGNFSYQAKHPPVYYLVLLLPEYLLKKANVSIFDRLLILRVLSYLLFLIGMLLCIPIIKHLNKLGFSIPNYMGYLSVFFGLLICTNERYGLGNNLLSPLLINLTILYLIKYYLKGDNKSLYLFLCCMCLACLSALTNVFFIPLFLLLVVYKFIKTTTLKNSIVSVSIIVFSAFLIFLWKQNTIADKAFEENMNFILKQYIPANALNYKDFINILTTDCFQLSFINKDLNLKTIIQVLVIFNFSICLLFCNTLYKKHKWIVVCMLTFVYYLTLIYFLNKYIDRITWSAFRHYLGFIPIIFVSCFGFIPILISKLKMIK